MGESESHIQLVRLLAIEISQSLLAGNSGLMLVDLPDISAKSKPIMVNNFVPDVLVPFSPNNIYVIGEAETARSIEARHTKEQIKAFLSKCAEYEESYFVLAVPWDMVRLGRAIIKETAIEIGVIGVNTRVLDQLPF
ncbi:hypothetical protein ACFLUD_01050 [Chloroflexota bacterium]